MKAGFPQGSDSEGVLTDSHCHLTAEGLIDDVEGVLDRARTAGVRRIVTIASSVEDGARAQALAARFPDVWSTAGIHPHEVASANAQVDVEALVRQAEGAGVVALGETGLDYHYDTAPRALQRDWFERHVEVARRVGLPLVVHSRNADLDTGDVVAQAGRAGVLGVLHCFTGSAALLKVALAAGWYIGYGGITTFKNFNGTDLLRSVPLGRLLLETDAPYLAPVPMRGHGNEPAYLIHSLARIAALLGCDATDLADATSENAARFFGLPERAA